MVCVTSGKGGVGKTTTSASLAMGLAERGFRVCAVDFDIGLRNLDLHLGCERRIVFDFVNVIQSECKLHQALIKDRHQPNLFMLAASQTRDKTALTAEGVEQVIEQLRSSFDYIICDSPAGIENGATQAMRHADIALVCTNPELSSVRDSDKMLSIVASKSKRAELNQEPVQPYLLITRYHPDRVAMDRHLYSRPWPRPLTRTRAPTRTRARTRTLVNPSPNPNPSPSPNPDPSPNPNHGQHARRR